MSSLSNLLLPTLFSLHLNLDKHCYPISNQACTTLTYHSPIMPPTYQTPHYSSSATPHFSTAAKAPATTSPYQPYYAPATYVQPLIHRRVPSASPERAESITTSGGTFSASSSDYDTSSTGGSSVDLLEYMSDRLSSTIDPTPLDRSLATQAQTSGALNAKQRELLELQALAQRRLAAAQTNFRDGLKAARDVQRELAWTQGRVTALNQRAAQKYPLQYRAASAKYSSPLDY
ncbi:hypothetical protein BDZ85DRAFT_255160 [Elsinoe ampelina]|uniref:Biogenesis of lysosome-related organelles complex 1 subunit KXD1 n=1 Tax=Elsinoe ampelina TaxID=302913 RepID=A0A6A6GQD6_9PEZI|nr:hypothetical protein BDZ85DRAFT_255160 [Elsinoe ampelina]